MKKAVILISGGMDSALCTAFAIEQGYTPAGFHLNYRQRTEKRELKAFNQLCAHWNIKDRIVIDTEFLAQIGQSSLTDKNIELTNADLESNEIPSSYVPFRNGILISLASAWAETISASAVIIGAMQLDSSGYPDCRLPFIKAIENAVNLGTKPETHIEIIPPLIDMTKKDIVENSIKLKVPLQLTWSCYANEDIACGVCDSCALRLRGFEQAGIKDPLEYLQRPIYK